MTGYDLYNPKASVPQEQNAPRIMRGGLWDAEAAMKIVRETPTLENIKVARAAIDEIPSSVGYDVDAVAWHEELDEISEKIRR